MVGQRELDSLLKALDAVLDVAGLARVEPAASALMQAAFNILSLVAQAVGGPVPDAIAPVQAVDLPLDIVDPLLERADLAPIAAEAIIVAIRRRLGRGIILGDRGAGGRQSGAGGGKGKNDLTHHGSP